MPSITDLILATTIRDCGVITINYPPINALSPGVPEGIQAAVEAFEKDDAIQAIVLIGGGRTFIAGADINEFGKITSGQKRDLTGIQNALRALENCSKPVVAALHGTAFGGGLEIATACHYRVAAPTAQVGQPEVKLGLIPGAGGTQRLPRLAGVVKAAEMCAGGEPIRAAEALQCGIVDRIIEEDLLEGAIDFALETAATGKPPRKTCDLNDKLADSAACSQALAAVREAVCKRARGLIAPIKAVEAVAAAATLPFAEGCQREAQLFQECLFSDQSKSLIHAFFGERLVGNIPGIPQDTPLIPIRRAAVVGAGTMGGGITMNYANAGIPVLLKEVSQEALDRGMATIAKNYAATVKKGRLTQSLMDERLALIQPTLNYN